MPYRLSNYERETVINYNAEDRLASVFTWNPKLQKQLSANPEAKLITQGQHKDPRDRWMKFEVPRELVGIRKRRKLSSEDRQKRSENLKGLRALKRVA